MSDSATCTPRPSPWARSPTCSGRADSSTRPSASAGRKSSPSTSDSATCAARPSPGPDRRRAGGPRTARRGPPNPQGGGAPRLRAPESRRRDLAVEQANVATLLLLSRDRKRRDEARDLLTAALKSAVDLKLPAETEYVRGVFRRFSLAPAGAPSEPWPPKRRLIVLSAGVGAVLLLWILGGPKVALCAPASPPPNFFLPPLLHPITPYAKLSDVRPPAPGAPKPRSLSQPKNTRASQRANARRPEECHDESPSRPHARYKCRAPSS
jgi:hypothetical protein